MADIVERLLKLAAVDNCQASLEAADEIERLRAALDEAQQAFANERYNVSQLRAALREIAKYTLKDGCECSACEHSAIARAALCNTEGK